MWSVVSCWHGRVGKSFTGTAASTCGLVVEVVGDTGVAVFLPHKLAPISLKVSLYTSEPETKGGESWFPSVLTSMWCEVWLCSPLFTTLPMTWHQLPGLVFDHLLWLLLHLLLLLLLRWRWSQYFQRLSNLSFSGQCNFFLVQWSHWWKAFHLCSMHEHLLPYTWSGYHPVN